MGRALLRTGDVAVAGFCVLSNFGIGILTGSFSSVNMTFIQDDNFCTAVQFIVQYHAEFCKLNNVQYLLGENFPRKISPQDQGCKIVILTTQQNAPHLQKFPHS